MDRAEHSSHAGQGVNTLVALVENATGASPTKCYQCGRCAAGCPQNVAGEMEISPTRIMHLLQLESAFAEEPDKAGKYARQALGADTCWLCAGCLACTTRCPQGVDIAGTMDLLRQEGLRRGVAADSRRARDIQKLHQVFLKSALKRGRIHEISMIMAYKLRAGHYLTDANLGPAMWLKGKMKLLGGHSVETTRVQAAIEKLRDS
jgi:heterodisulfide reductase subunit C